MHVPKLTLRDLGQEPVLHLPVQQVDTSPTIHRGGPETQGSERRRQVPVSRIQFQDPIAAASPPLRSGPTPVPGVWAIRRAPDPPPPPPGGGVGGGPRKPLRAARSAQRGMAVSHSVETPRTAHSAVTIYIFVIAFGTPVPPSPTPLPRPTPPGARRNPPRGGPPPRVVAGGVRVGVRLFRPPGVSVPPAPCPAAEERRGSQSGRPDPQAGWAGPSASGRQKPPRLWRAWLRPPATCSPQATAASGWPAPRLTPTPTRPRLHVEKELRRSRRPAPVIHIAQMQGTHGVKHQAAGSARGGWRACLQTSR